MRMSSANHSLSWLWLSLLIVVLDQVTKYWASSTLSLHQSVPVIPFFNLTLMHNSGAAFSFLADAGGWQRWFFTALALVVGVVIVYWLNSLRGQPWLAAGLALILGGAVGNNLIDRVFYGYVVDFIDLYYQSWHWPAFNIADSAITVGALMLIVDALFFSRQEHD
jgi:signal peptidase II